MLRTPKPDRKKKEKYGGTPFESLNLNSATNSKVIDEDEDVVEELMEENRPLKRTKNRKRKRNEMEEKSDIGVLNEDLLNLIPRSSRRRLNQSAFWNPAMNPFVSPQCTKHRKNAKGYNSGSLASGFSIIRSTQSKRSKKGKNVERYNFTSLSTKSSIAWSTQRKRKHVKHRFFSSTISDAPRKKRENIDLTSIKQALDFSVTDSPTPTPSLSETFFKLAPKHFPKWAFIDKYINDIGCAGVLPRYRSSDHKVIVLPDYSLDKQSICATKFVHIKKLDSGWVCDCSYFNQVTAHAYCYHVPIGILQSDGNHNNIAIQAYQPPEVSTDVILLAAPLDGHRRLVFSVKANNGEYNVVHWNSKQLWMCSKHKRSSCPCRESVKKVLPGLTTNPIKPPDYHFDDATGFLESAKEIAAKRPLSQHKIPVPRRYRTEADNAPLQKEFDKYQKSIHIVDPFFRTKTNDNILDLYPRCNKCPKCGDAFTVQNACYMEHATVYTRDCTFQARIHALKCGTCCKLVHYDGLLDRIIYLKKGVCFTHDIFVQWEMGYRNGVTMNAYVKGMCDNYSENNSLTRFPTAPTVIKYYTLYRSLVAWDKRHRCSVCCKQGHLPDMLAIDGTGQLIRKEHIQHTITPKLTNCMNTIQVNIRNKINNIRTIYLTKSSTARQKLEDWLITENITRWKTDKDAAKRKQSFSDLIKSLKREDNLFQTLIAFLKMFQKYQSSKGKCPDLVKYIGTFLRNFSNPTILNAIIPFPIAKVLSEYEPKSWPKLEHEVTNQKPHIALLINQFRKSKLRENPEWIALLRETASLSLTMVHKLEEARADSPPLTKAAATEATQSIFRDTSISGCSYRYRVHHTRPTYDSDSIKVKSNSTTKGDKDMNEMEIPHGNCNKYYQKYTDLSNGVMVALCPEHNEVIGWHTLKEPESVNDIFSLIIMMYPENQAPKLVISDFSCQLQRYCMYREPAKFKNTLFLNDAFHAGGHKCGPYYSTSLYCDKVREMYRLNCSRIESLNALLARCRRTTKYQSLPTFTSGMDHILEVYSRESIQKKQKLIKKLQNQNGNNDTK